MPFNPFTPRQAVGLMEFAVQMQVDTVIRQAVVDGQVVTLPPEDVVTLRYRYALVDAQGQVIERVSGNLRENLNAEREGRLDEIARWLYAKAKAEVLAR